MARRVKCQDTGEYSTSDVAYRAANGKYYSSMAGYQQLEAQQKWRQKCIDLLFDIVGYSKNMIAPGVFWKNLKSYESMGYETVYETILGKQRDIEWALYNVPFKSESGRISYVCKIIESNLADYYKMLQDIKRVPRKEIDIPEDTTVNNKKQQTKDIRRFLEE